MINENVWINKLTYMYNILNPASVYMCKKNNN